MRKYDVVIFQSLGVTPAFQILESTQLTGSTSANLCCAHPPTTYDILEPSKRSGVASKVTYVPEILTVRQSARVSIELP